MENAVSIRGLGQLLNRVLGGWAMKWTSQQGHLIFIFFFLN